MFPLQEPLWWQSLVMYLNDYMKYHDFLITIVPITADIFVFFFPVLLVVLYIIGMVKKNDNIKESSLWIFWSAIITSVVNVCLQFFFEKARPSVLIFGQLDTETLLHKFLPNSSFPSDHAAMSMWFAIGILLLWIRNKKKIYIWLWVIFLLFSLIMWVSRIMVWVHWPTDIIWGFLIWIIVPIILFSKPVYGLLKKFLIDPLIKLQKKIINR